MDVYIRSISKVSQLCGIFAACLIGVGVLVVCDMVFERYVLDQNTIWQTDFVTYCLIAATFVGSPYVLMTRGHVNVDVLPLHLGPRARFWLALFTTLVGIAFCLAMVVLTCRYWRDAWDENWRSNTVWRARLWIPYASMPLGLAILSLQYVAQLMALVTGRDPPFGITEEGRHP